MMLMSLNIFINTNLEDFQDPNVNGPNLCLYVILIMFLKLILSPSHSNELNYVEC